MKWPSAVMLLVCCSALVRGSFAFSNGRDSFHLSLSSRQHTGQHGVLMSNEGFDFMAPHFPG
ncbi:unnamed protein product [Heterosigma akashiwo]